jgi:hypothetical protein
MAHSATTGLGMAQKASFEGSRKLLKRDGTKTFQGLVHNLNVADQ